MSDHLEDIHDLSGMHLFRKNDGTTTVFGGFRPAHKNQIHRGMTPGTILFEMILTLEKNPRTRDGFGNFHTRQYCMIFLFLRTCLGDTPVHGDDRLSLWYGLCSLHGDHYRKQGISADRRLDTIPCFAPHARGQKHFVEAVQPGESCRSDAAVVRLFRILGLTVAQVSDRCAMAVRQVEILLSLAMSDIALSK